MRINPNSRKPLRVIRRSFMIKNSIPVNPNPQILCKPDKFLQLSLGAPFRPSRPLLLKLAQVIQIINVIPVPRRAHTFAPRRDPDIVNPDIFETGEGFVQAVPVGLVVWDVPLEGLHHEGVVGGVP